MKYPPYTENQLRSNIINALFDDPKLGADYIDWHTDEGKCGLTLTFGKSTFDIIIEKKN